MSNRLNCEAPPQPEARAARECVLVCVQLRRSAARPPLTHTTPSTPPRHPSVVHPLLHLHLLLYLVLFYPPPPPPPSPNPHPTTRTVPPGEPPSSPTTPYAPLARVAFDSLYPRSVFLSAIFRLLTCSSVNRS